MQAHEERVVIEKKELDDKLNKLLVFIGTEPFLKIAPTQRILLKKQANVMKQYSLILQQRIAEF